ncbi:hypothetical protein G3I01_05510 [Gramella sp. MT6]|uniref:DUF6730 family protein n=1 Tax=Gramella sp. MT6 TaxID=2705471 RepID=UPI001C5CE6E7|nr:DUF6730 family protein [Gramella sp. MT6]QYA24989.1 hypothetical protein G3I01_05510 [Gramella sp. MT6]
MKKLDEIMELMTDEMTDFKAAILQLKEYSKELENMSIPITTEVLDKHLNDFLKDQKEENDLKIDTLKEINGKLQGAILIPKYILLLFGGIIIILLFLLMYFIFL